MGIPQGEMRFRWFAATYSYRNDIDVIGVRAGCTFTGYSDSSFNGQRIVMPLRVLAFVPLKTEALACLPLAILLTFFMAFFMTFFMAFFMTFFMAAFMTFFMAAFLTFPM